MLLVGLIKKPVEKPKLLPSGLAFRILCSLGSYQVIAVTDSFMSNIEVTASGWLVTESAMPSRKHTESAEIDEKQLEGINILSVIIIDKQASSLSIFKPTHSGRSLYYYMDGRDSAFFCSTHISLLKHFGVPICENSAVLPEFFVYRYVMPPNTLYFGIKQFLSGQRMRVSVTGNSISMKETCHFTPPPETIRKDLSMKAIANRNLDILKESLRFLLPFKDKPAVLLSGGLDSSILAVILKTLCGVDITFSTDYPFDDEESSIEKKYALTAAEALGTSHTYYKVSTRDYLRGFIEAIGALEEPLPHLQSVMFYLLYGSGIPKERYILLQGFGVDGAYGPDICYLLHRYRLAGYLAALPGMQNLLLLGSWVIGKGQPLVRLLRMPRGELSDPEHILWHVGAYGSIEWVQQTFGVSKERIIEGRLATLSPYQNYSLNDLISIYNVVGEVAVEQFMCSKLGEKQERIIIVPYANQEVLDFVYTIPWALKLQEYKHVLREVARLAGIPEFIITRPKSGFGTQTDAWAVRGGAFEPLLQICDDVFDIIELQAMQSEEPKSANTFWNMLNYAIWKQIHIDGKSVSDLTAALNIG